MTSLSKTPQGKLTPQAKADRIRAILPGYDISAVHRNDDVVSFQGTFRPDEPGEKPYQEAFDAIEKLRAAGMNIRQGEGLENTLVMGAEGAVRQTVKIRIAPAEDGSAGQMFKA